MSLVVGCSSMETDSTCSQTTAPCLPSIGASALSSPRSMPTPPTTYGPIDRSLVGVSFRLSANVAVSLLACHAFPDAAPSCAASRADPALHDILDIAIPSDRVGATCALSPDGRLLAVVDTARAMPDGTCAGVEPGDACVRSSEGEQAKDLSAFGISDPNRLSRSSSKFGSI